MTDKPKHDHTSECDRLMAEMLERIPPKTCEPQDCTHPDFAAAVAVARLEDSGVISAEVRITCVACHVPMRFIGSPAGWSPHHPTTSIDGLELMAPIEAELVKQLRDRASYTMPAIPARH